MSDETRKTMNGKPVFDVPSKTVLNLQSLFRDKLLCDGPTFTAGTACVYSCAFCYVPDMFRKQKHFLAKHGVSGRHEHIVVRREGAVDVLDRQLHEPKAKALWDKPLTIYSSPAVDVAGNMELARESVEMCKVILELTHWDIRLLSKSNLLPQIAQMLEKQYDEHLTPTLSPPGAEREKTTAKQRVIYGVSTGTLDDKLAAAFERGCPLVSKRIESLHWLQDNGFRTFGMVCPSLPQWKPGADEHHAYLEWASEMAAAIRADRCEHVWAEVINLRGESFTRTEKALRGAGFGAMADELLRVSRDKAEWEKYAQATFLAHAGVAANRGKLRFLQYATKSTGNWWRAHQEQGAVVL